MNYVSDCCGIPIKRIYLYRESKVSRFGDIKGELEHDGIYFICVCDPYSKVKSETKDGRPRYGCGLPCTPEEEEE